MDCFINTSGLASYATHTRFIMGCCYCDCKEFADQISADLSTTLISTEASGILKELQDTSSSLQTYSSEPFITSDVEAWTRGDIARYTAFLQGMKERGKKAREQVQVAVNMTDKHYEAAIRETVEFYKGVKAELPAPDIDWPIVVGTLATKFTDIQSLKKRFDALSLRFHQHLKECALKFEELDKLNNSDSVSKEYKDEVEARKRKVEETKATNQEIDGKMKEFKGELERAFEVAKECVILLKVFYVEIKEEAGKPPESGEKGGKSGENEEKPKEIAGKQPEMQVEERKAEEEKAPLEVKSSETA